MGGQNEETDAMASSSGCPSSQYNETHCLYKEKISTQQTMHDTLPQTCIEGHKLFPLSPTHSKMCNKNSYSSQTAILSPHMHIQKELCSPYPRDCPISRESSQCVGSAIDMKCSCTNIEATEKLTKLSVNQIEQSTTLYSPERRPKVPDKSVWCINNRNDTKVCNTPRPAGRDGSGQSLRWQQDAHAHQRSHIT